MTNSDWDAAVGPFFSAADTAAYVDVAEVELAAMADRLELIRVHTSDDVSLYPSRQFVDGAVPERLPELLAVLSTGPIGEWTLASWCLMPIYQEDGSGWPEYGPYNAIDMLARGLGDFVLRNARQDVSRWSS